MKLTKYKKDFKEHTKNATGYKLSGDDKVAHDFFQKRKEELKLHRKNLGIEEIWQAADLAYQPHTSKAKKKGVFVSNDELGWRSTKQILTSEEDWMDDTVPVSPYIKIQTALGIIVDRNPSATFKPGKKKYVGNTSLIEDLYNKTWTRAHSKSALLKPFVFNQAKYGIGVGRTYPLKVTRTVDDLVTFNPTGPSKYKATDFTYYDDVFRESLSPWQCWFDDGGMVGNPLSFNDNMWYKDYSWQRFEGAFSHLPNFQYVVPTQQVLTREDQKDGSEIKDKGLSKYQIRVWFYENLELDRLIVETEGGVVLVNEPLPQKPKNKHLSLYAAPWTLRNDSTIYGIGVYEAMRGDHKKHTKLSQMTMDQVVQSIYKEFFYEGTDTMQGDGVMKTQPGRGRQVTNPQNIKWNEVPGPGSDAWAALDRQEQKIDEATGVTKGLTGEVVGKTAFETAQARESALKRLKTPLENLTDALTTDAYITVSIIEDLYSIPKIKLIAEDRYIELSDLQGLADEEGNLPQYNEEFREIPLNVKKDNEGFSFSEEEQFVSLKPENLPWEGAIRVNGESMIADSELLDRTTTLEMANMIIPLLAQPPEIALKPATEIIKVYKKDPKDWLPDAWSKPPQPMFQPTQGQMPPESNPEGMTPPPQADTVLPESQVPGLTTPSDSLNATM